MHPVQATESPSIPTAPQQGMQILTPLEISAVAGGPESSVGTGLNPP